MLKLLNANLFRLRKSNIFKLSLFLVILIKAAVTIINCLSIKGEKSEYSLESIVLSGAPFIQIISTVVIIIIMGTDHSQNTIRNKLFVGHTRKYVYIANLVTSIIIGCSINAAWLVGGFAGIPILGSWEMPFSQAIIYILILMLCTISVSAVISLICMLLRRKSTATVCALITVLVMLIVSSNLCSRLNQSKEVMNASVVDGDMVFSIEQNSRYINGTKRMVCEIAVHTIPLGTSIMLSNINLNNPWADAAGTILVTIYISAVGVAVFNRKDEL